MRHVVAVSVGVALSFLAIPLSGYFLYQLLESSPQSAVLARYLINPLVALLVGLFVGALSKSRAGTLAALSLGPWAFSFAWVGRRNQAHLMTLIILGFLYLLLGVAAGIVTFRIRTRDSGFLPGSRLTLPAQMVDATPA